MYPRHDSEPKMHTIYECIGKAGTKGTTVLWFLEAPKKGTKVYGISEDDHISPYMEDMVFRYAEFKLYVIDEVYSNGFVVCHRC